MIELLDGRNKLYQWDTDRYIVVSSACTQVHFRASLSQPAIPVDVKKQEGKYVALIPPELLQDTKDIVVYAYTGSPECGYTQEERVFEVIAKPKPADYVFTPKEQMTLKEVLEEVRTIKKNAEENGVVGIIGPQGPKGDKGDKLTYEDLTEEDKKDLVKDIKPFFITADVNSDFSEISNLSATYEEIKEAYDSGKTLILILNVSLDSEGTVAQVSLRFHIHLENTMFLFTGFDDTTISGSVTAWIYPDNSTYFHFTQYAERLYVDERLEEVRTQEIVLVSLTREDSEWVANISVNRIGEILRYIANGIDVMLECHGENFGTAYLPLTESVGGGYLFSGIVCSGTLSHQHLSILLYTDMTAEVRVSDLSSVDYVKEQIGDIDTALENTISSLENIVKIQESLISSKPLPDGNEVEY